MPSMDSWIFRMTPTYTGVTNTYSPDDNFFFLETYINSNEPTANPPSLRVILEFVKRVDAFHSKQRAIALIARREGKFATSAALLVGSFMICVQGMAVTEVMARLSKTCSDFVAYHDGLGLRDCLSALHHSMSLGRLRAQQKLAKRVQNQSDVSTRNAILAGKAHIREDIALHLTNGCHFLIPSKLMLFTCDHVFYMRKAAHDPTCLAALFLRLGICLVLRVGVSRSTPHDLLASVLEARGITVEDLPLGPGGLHMLRAFDTLLAILRAAAGPIAIYADEAALAAARPLLAACLISVSGFTPAAAEAWLRMARPATPTADRPRPARSPDSAAAAGPRPADPAVDRSRSRGAGHAAGPEAAGEPAHFRGVHASASRDGPACQGGPLGPTGHRRSSCCGPGPAREAPP